MNTTSADLRLKGMISLLRATDSGALIIRALEAYSQQLKGELAESAVDALENKRISILTSEGTEWCDKYDEWQAARKLLHKLEGND